MAIDPSAEYGAQVDTSDPTGYPLGQARNITTAGDGTGTPLERKWVSDIWGLLQALLASASIAPSGVPDKVGASQYLTALIALITARVSSGSFSTLSGGESNITGLSPDVANYVRIGTWVLVWGQASYTNGGAGAKSFTLSLAGALPTNNFVATSQAVGWFNELSSGDVTPGAVRAQVGTKTVAVSWSTAASSGARTGQFMFIYSAE